MSTRPESAKIDVDEARRLIDALERDLRQQGGPSAGIDTLMAEIAQLRKLLDASEQSDTEVHSGLHGMRDRLHHLSDELVGDAFQAGRYFAELGRILGLG